MGTDHNIFYILHARYLARSSDEVLFPAMFNIACPHVGIVLHESFHNTVESDSISHQFFRVRSNLILLHKTADTVDIRDAGNIAQLRTDDPILNRS